MSIRIITDSASDSAELRQQNVTVLPLSITFGTQTYQDGVDLSHAQFYEKLASCKELPTTSQVSPHAFQKAFQDTVSAGDIGICITISSKLSGTYQSAVLAAQDFPGRIWVIDSLSVSLGERILVELALRLRDQSLDAEAIVNQLEDQKKQIRVIALMHTLEYLKRGGRISRTAAFAGGILSIKPVIAIQDGEISVLGKARGSKQGNNLLVQQIRKNGGVDFSQPHILGYTGTDDSLIQTYIQDCAALWQPYVSTLTVSTIGGTIGTHAGPGAIGVAFFAKTPDSVS